MYNYCYFHANRDGLSVGAKHLRIKRDRKIEVDLGEEEREREGE